ncbi:MAG: choice-of-anchor A family protein, partial [Oscillospiraceae bacterium]|nr:choice-of-anchor A family protein [Oscillospiraceae bacterium]
MRHQSTHGESEESDEAEEAVDTTGDGDDEVNTDEAAVAAEAAEAVGAGAEAPAEEAAAEETTETEAAVEEAAPAEEAAAVAETPAAEAAEESDAEAVESVRSILGGANGYNVFVEGNYTQTGNNNIDVGDGGGVVAVGGNVDVGEGINHKGSSFEVGGSVTGTLQGDKVAVGEECSVDFKTTFDELRATSSAISKAEGTTVSNGSDSSYIKSEYGTITLKGSDSDVNIFNMTVDEFNAMKTSENMALRYDVPDGSTVILNIVGEGDVNLVFDWGAYYNGGSLTSGNKEGNSKVMINVPDGNNVTIASGVGSLLAPSSSVSSGEDRGYNPHYEGQVICKDFSGNIEFGSSSFDYTVKEKPNKPDPDPDTPNTPTDPDPDPDPETTAEPTEEEPSQDQGAQHE